MGHNCSWLVRIKKRTFGYKFCFKEGMKWCFTKSSDAPWQNGVSESLIRLAKRGLCMAIGESVLTFGELLTTLFNVANLISKRPFF